MSAARKRSATGGAQAPRKKHKKQSPIYRHTFTVRGVPEPTGADAATDESKVAYFNGYMAKWKSALTAATHLNIANFVFQVERGHENQKLHLQGYIHIGGRGQKSQGIRPATLAKKLEAVGMEAGIPKDASCNQWISCQPVSNNGVYVKAMEKYVMKADTRVPGILPIGKRKIYRGNGKFKNAHPVYEYSHGFDSMNPFTSYGRITIQRGRPGPLFAKRYRTHDGILIGVTNFRNVTIRMQPRSASMRAAILARRARQRARTNPYR